MREVHKKYICLYCLGIFQSADKLVTHLEAKHQVRKKHVASIDEYQQQQQQQNMDTSKPLYLMCARCEHIFEKESTDDGAAIVQHDCADYLERCGNCGELKQSKHKCDKKVEQPPEQTRLFSNNLSSSNNINSSVKSNLNNYDGTSVSSNSTAVMLNYDKHTVNGNSTHENIYQGNSLLRTGPGHAPPNRKPQNKKTKLSHPNQTLSLQQDHFQNFNSPILQSQLLKPLEAPVQLPAPVSYPPELLQNQQQQSYLLQLPPAQVGFSQNTTTTLSTIPASLLNVQEAPTELPPVPTELPLSAMVAQQQQQASREEDEQLDRPPLVPKLKVKIPKEYCTPIESEESSTESDYEDEGADQEDDDDDDEEEEEQQQEHPEEQQRVKGDELANTNEVEVSWFVLVLY